MMDLLSSDAHRIACWSLRNFLYNLFDVNIPKILLKPFISLLTTQLEIPQIPTIKTIADEAIHTLSGYFYCWKFEMRTNLFFKFSNWDSSKNGAAREGFVAIAIGKCVIRSAVEDKLLVKMENLRKSRPHDKKHSLGGGVIRNKSVKFNAATSSSAQNIKSTFIVADVPEQHSAAVCF